MRSVRRHEATARELLQREIGTNSFRRPMEQTINTKKESFVNPSVYRVSLRRSRLERRNESSTTVSQLTDVEAYREVFVLFWPDLFGVRLLSAGTGVAGFERRRLQDDLVTIPSRPERVSRKSVTLTCSRGAALLARP